MDYRQQNTQRHPQKQPEDTFLALAHYKAGEDSMTCRMGKGYRY